MVHSALEDDGALAGDSMIRGIKAGIASIVGEMFLLHHWVGFSLSV